MKILEVKEESAHVLIAFEIDPDVLKKEYENRFSQISKHVTVSGFRKGHAPINMVVQHLKSRGSWIPELQLIVNRIIEKEVAAMPKTNPELDKKFFGMPIDIKIRDDADLERWFMQVDARFEKFPEVTLIDYSEIPTLIEHKEPDLNMCPVTSDKSVESEDVVAIAMMGKNKNGEVEMKYTYDMIEIDLSNTKINKKITDSLIGLKSKDKKEISFEDSKLGTINLEIWVIEVRNKEKVDEKLVEKLQVPGIATVEQLREAIRKQHEIHNSYVRYQDIMKWLISSNNKVIPFPVENVRREASKFFENAKKRGSKDTLESCIYTHTRNLKQTLVINAIAKKEDFGVTEQDKSDFAADIDSHPWLYGNRTSEQIFNCDEEVLNEYVLQFKTVRFLMDRWKFSV